jgi:hypothetical protein
MRGVGVCVRAGLPCVTVCVHVRMVLARVCVAGCVEPCRVWVVFGGLCVRAVICSKVLADVERERVCVCGGGGGPGNSTRATSNKTSTVVCSVWTEVTSFQ